MLNLTEHDMYHANTYHSDKCKMPTIVSILTFMSMINTSWSLKERLILVLKAVKISFSVELGMKKV